MRSMIIVALALVAVAVAVPVVPQSPQIVRYNFEQAPEGSYNYSYESEDGIAREEEGQVKEVLDENNKVQKVVVVRGKYSYPSQVDPNIRETITYHADENGYIAEGPSVPKAERR